MQQLVSARSKKIGLSAVVGLSLSIAPLQNISALDSAQNYELAIVNVKIVSPERAKLLESSVVLIRDGSIASIEAIGSAFTAETIIDGAGKYLIPGLIDSHVHLYHATGLKRRYSDQFDVLYASYMAQMPRSYLYHGFTTVIETNADAQTNRRFTSAAPRPDLEHCGAGLILSDGYMASEIPDGELLNHAPNFLHDRFRDGYLPTGVDPEHHTPKATVAKIAESGAACVKLYYEEALWMPGGPPDIKLPTREIVSEVVQEAHRRGLSVIMHATSPKGHAFAVAAGVDIISHGPWDWAGNNYADPQIPARIQDNLIATAASGVSIQPTISSIQHTASLFKPASLDDPALTHVLPSDYITYLQTDAQVQREIFLGIFGPLLGPEPTAEKIASLQANFIRRYKRMVGMFAANGGKLLLGTDTSSGGFGWGNPPGLNGYWEMKDWVESGVPLRAVFAAATINNAKAFGLSAEIGTIEVGKRANLLLLESNPLETVEAYDTIETVIVGGQAISRGMLSAKAER